MTNLGTHNLYNCKSLKEGISNIILCLTLHYDCCYSIHVN